MRCTFKTCPWLQHCVLIPTEDLQSPGGGGGGFACYLQRFKTGIMEKGVKGGEEALSRNLEKCIRVYCTEPKTNRSFGEGGTSDPEA